jgi:hypothetical protein
LTRQTRGLFIQTMRSTFISLVIQHAVDSASR